MNRGNFKGYWIKDELLSFIKRHSAFAATCRDGRQFSVEIDRVGSNMFSVNEDEKHFEIKHSNEDLRRYLHEYFLRKHSRLRDRLYRDHFSLGNLFNDFMQQLAIYGECFYVIDWGQKQHGEMSYFLPTGFRYLSNSTMFIKKGDNNSVVGYQQRYSPFARLSYDLNEDKLRRFDFENDEIFYTKYPLEEVHPVKKSIHLLKPILNFWDFGLNRGERGVNPQNKRLNVVMASHQRYSHQKRKAALTRAKVRKNFHYLLNVDDLTTTEYYDIFFVARYKKELNKSREYFVSEFNRQIFEPFVIKNSLTEVPTLELVGFMTNKEIDDWLGKYKRREITSKQFVEKVVNQD
jgi:hypothetical protein